jgi:hypothetical protein
MLAIVVLLIMGVVVYSYLQEGLLTAITMAVNVMFSGIVAFGFFEPVAGEIGTWLNQSILEGYEDAIALGLLFCAVFGALKLAANNLAPQEMDLPPLFQQIGSGVVAAVGGYFLAGFLLCMVQTLPLGDKVLGYDPLENVEAQPTLANYFPPDRVWLAMMHRMGQDNLSWGEGSVTFDPEGTFTLRYSRLRRYKLPSAP